MRFAPGGGGHKQGNTMSSARESVTLAEPLTLRGGGRLESVTLAYETWGTLAPARDNVMLLFTGLSPSAHAASSERDPSPGWWEFMLGPGKPIDTERFFVICVNSLGSCFGSTGPASINPTTGERYATDFPRLTVEDIARAGREACRALGIERVHTVAGASLGGMDVLAYALLFPGEYRDLISLCAGPHATPFAIGLRSLQREIIRNDPAWQGGRYAPDAQPASGMLLARKLGMMTYRSGEEWLERFGRARIEDPVPLAQDPFRPEFQIEAYIDANSRKFIGAFDANCYLYLSQAMDLFDVAEHGDDGTVDSALAKITAERALIAGVATDWLFPIWQQRQLARGLTATGAEVDLHELGSLQGHDAFLVDRDRFAPMVARFLAGDRA